MIFVTGGASQGKRAFSENAFITPSGSCPVVWCDGDGADWDTFMKERYGWNFHLFIRRAMLGEVEKVPQGLWPVLDVGQEKKERGWTWEKLEGPALFLVESLMAANPDRILVTDDIGYGIVPADCFERIYREETGRICCQAAARAEQVWRVCCGLGQRIK